MTAIGHKAVFQTTQTGTISTAFSTKLTLSSADVTADATYLVLCYAQVGNTSSSGQTKARLAHGAAPTVFTGSGIELEPSSGAAGQFHSYGYMTVWTAPNPAVDIVFQLASNTGGSVAIADSMAILIMKLSDSNANMTEGVDWFFNENTTSTTHATFFQNFATVSPTISSSEKWLVIANMNYAVGSSETSAEYRINESQTPETVPFFVQEGESAGDQKDAGRNHSG